MALPAEPTLEELRAPPPAERLRFVVQRGRMIRTRGAIIAMALGLWGALGCGSQKSDPRPVDVDTQVIDVRPGAGRYCSIAASGNVVLVAYDGPLETGGVYLARSDDGGATFDQSKTVLIDPAGLQTQSVTITGQTIYVGYGGDEASFGATSARLARSDDGGHTFAVQTIASDAAGPAILVVGDTVYLSYQAISMYQGISSTTRGVVYFQRSEDRGVTWSAPVHVPSPGSSSYPPAILGSVDRSLGLRMISGVLEATFYDTFLNTQATAHSSDSGESWIVERGQAAIATGSMVVDGDAMILPLVDDGDGLYLAESTDFGATWTRRDFQVAGGAHGDNPLGSLNTDSTVAGVRLAVADATMYAIFDQGTSGGLPTLGIAQSRDHGASWPAADVVTAFAVQPRDGQIFTRYLEEFAGIAVSAAPERAVLIALFDGTSLRVLRSTDDGATWH